MKRPPNPITKKANPILMNKRPTTRRRKKAPVDESRLVRLQKAIASAGICSRREAERLILQGKVKVDGKVVTEMGLKVDPERARISVDGQGVQTEKKVYYVLYKPAGTIVSAKDEAGRPTVFSLINEKRRLFSAGRLDWDSEGVLLLTNDGELVHALTHPSRHMVKEYEVKVKGRLSQDQLFRLGEGVDIGDGLTQPCVVEPLRSTKMNSWYLFILNEGRNRQIKRMLETVDATCLKIKRTRFATLDLEGLLPGESRPLDLGEIHELRNLVGLVPDVDIAPISSEPPREEKQKPVLQKPKRPQTSRGKSQNTRSAAPKGEKTSKTGPKGPKSSGGPRKQTRKKDEDVIEWSTSPRDESRRRTRKTKRGR